MGIILVYQNGESKVKFTSKNTPKRVWGIFRPDPWEASTESHAASFELLAEAKGWKRMQEASRKKSRFLEWGGTDPIIST